MENFSKTPSASTGEQLLALIKSLPAEDDFQRSFLQILSEALESPAITMWKITDEGLEVAEHVEQKGRQGVRINLPEQDQQEALRKAVQEGKGVHLSEGGAGFDPISGVSGGGRGHVLFQPLMDRENIAGVLRVLLPPQPQKHVRQKVKFCEVLAGYFSFYRAYAELSRREGDQAEIDHLSRSLLQLQHYTFSANLPEVVVNSAVEIASLDRAVLLVWEKSSLKVESVSSAVMPNKKAAWNKLCCELGELVLEREEPLEFFPDEESVDQIPDAELREKVNSYVLMTDVKSLLCFPLRSHSDRVGVLICEKMTEPPLSDVERKNCTIYATHVASVVENHRIFMDLPLSGIYAKRLSEKGETTKRGPLPIGKITKWMITLFVLAAILWLVCIHSVPEKVKARCFVEPFRARIVTSRIAGEVKNVYFDLGEFVQEGTPLIELRSEDIKLALNKEKENAKNIQAEIIKLRGEAEAETDIGKRGQSLAQLAIKQHALEAKRQEIKILEKQLQYCFLNSPISGTVIEPDEPRSLIGVTVSKGETLCRIGRIRDKVKVKVAIPAERICKVEFGQKVEIKLRPLLGRDTFEGEICCLAQRSVTYKESNVFMADVTLPNRYRTEGQASGELLLKPGMTGKAYIYLGTDSCYLSIYARELYRKIRYWLF
jgi:multidrug efflux pump subunit AcrA (membrane-fusion protein)